MRGLEGRIHALESRAWVKMTENYKNCQIKQCYLSVSHSHAAWFTQKAQLATLTATIRCVSTLPHPEVEPNQQTGAKSE